MHEAQSRFEMETTLETKAMVIGRLGDLGLGNPEGIPSSLAEASPSELQTKAEEYASQLVYPDDLSCHACIDGRRCKHNADGSEPKTRLRRVGGSASNYGSARNASAPIMMDIDPEASLYEQIDAVDDAVGFRSAHFGKCGGANGDSTDHALIATNPAIVNAACVLMELPDVKAYLGASWSQDTQDSVQFEATETAVFLRKQGWNGQDYVDRVAESNPENVEVLEVDETDTQYHGHKEPALLIIIGDKTMPLDFDGFVWNLKATRDFAEKVSKGNHDAYQRAIFADIAKHMATAKRLPSVKTPVFLLAG